MAIQRIPGWWDEIGQGITSLVGQLPKVFTPNTVAQKKLQEMIQQDPTILDRVANMDDAQRAMFAQGVGFKNQNPFQQLPAGQQRIDREEKNKAVAAIQGNPEAQAERDAFLTNTQTPKQRHITDTTLEGRIIDNKTGQLKLDVLQKEVSRNEKILERDAPDIAKTARAAAFGQPIPVEQLERINADPNLREAFGDYFKGFQLTREHNLRMALQSMKSPQERMMAISWMDKEMDNTRTRIRDLQQMTSGRNGFMTMFSDRAGYDAAIKQQEELTKRLSDYQEMFDGELTKMGIKLQRPGNPTAAPIAPVTPGPMANPNNRPPLNAIDMNLFRR